MVGFYLVSQTFEPKLCGGIARQTDFSVAFPVLFLWLRHKAQLSLGTLLPSETIPEAAVGKQMLVYGC